MSRHLPRFLLILALTAELVGLFPGLTPRAQALWWEDDSSLSDPKEKVNRPSGFFLTNWINGLDQEAKEARYKDLENRDHGPSVNNGQKAIVIIASSLVGLGAGLVTSYTLTDATTQDMFIGGALGLCAGIGVGALMMPTDYEVDQASLGKLSPLAWNSRLSYRMAFAQDPAFLKTRKAFQPSCPVVAFKF